MCLLDKIPELLRKHQPYIRKRHTNLQNLHEDWPRTVLMEEKWEDTESLGPTSRLASAARRCHLSWRRWSFQSDNSLRFQ